MAGAQAASDPSGGRGGCGGGGARAGAQGPSSEEAEAVLLLGPHFEGLRASLDACMESHKADLRQLVQRLEELSDSPITALASGRRAAAHAVPLRRREQQAQAAARAGLRPPDASMTGLGSNGSAVSFAVSKSSSAATQQGDAAALQDQDVHGVSSANSEIARNSSQPEVPVAQSMSRVASVDTNRLARSSQVIRWVQTAKEQFRTNKNSDSKLFTDAEEMKNRRTRVSQWTTSQNSGHSFGTSAVSRHTLQVVFDEAKDVRRDNFRAKLLSLVKSHAFQAFAGLLIFTDAAVVGIQTDYQARHGRGIEPLRNLMLVLSLSYFLEVTLRIIAEGQSFFTDEEMRAWNLFDLVLAASSMADFAVELMAVSQGPASQGKLMQLLRVVRVVRILRSLRLVRWLRHMREFRKMVFSLLVSIQTLLWAIVLLLFIMYTFAIWFTAGLSEYIRESEEHEGYDELCQYFGNVAYSMYSLWLSVSGGVNWFYIVEPLWGVHHGLALLFVAYISITVLGVMNIVTSVFVESAMRSTQHYKDLMLQEKARTKEMFGKHLKDIFHQIDIDGSGQINMEELRNFLDDETLQLQSYFEALEVDAQDAKALFKLLDRDDSGDIDMYEFCEGCLRLKGEAKSFDINCLLHYSRRMDTKICQIMDGFFVFVDLFEQFLQKPADSAHRQKLSNQMAAVRRSNESHSEPRRVTPAPPPLTVIQEGARNGSSGPDPGPLVKPAFLAQRQAARGVGFAAPAAAGPAPAASSALAAGSAAEAEDEEEQDEEDDDLRAI